MTTSAAPTEFLAPAITSPASRTLLAASSATAESAASPQSAKLRKAAGEFESMLLESLWKSMKETFTDDSDESADPITDGFDDFGMHSMALSVGQAGGLGIKNMIINSLESKAQPPVPGENGTKRWP